MRILIASGHPAQVHNFKYVKEELEKKGHQVFWMATNKDISRYLLNCFSIKHILMPRPKKNLVNKIIQLIRNSIKCIKFLNKYDIDLIVSRLSPYCTLSGWLKGIPHIALVDTESSGVYDLVLAKFVDVLITPKSYFRNIKKTQIRFNGNIELFYLHPNRFHIENIPNVLFEIAERPYIIIRFVSWQAHHDKGIKGISDQNKIKAVKEFSKFANVYISSEKDLPAELEPYKISIPPEKMHFALAGAKIFYGESGTMASESAILGTPAIFVNDHWLGYIKEEKEAGLAFCFTTSNRDQLYSIEKGTELLSNPDLEKEMQLKRSSFLKKKIDPTEFLAWFIEEYPQSKTIIESEPDYQNRFKS